MKYLLISVMSLTLVSGTARAGAVDDSIDCIAKGKASCSAASATEDVRVENVNFKTEEAPKAPEQNEVDI